MRFHYGVKPEELSDEEWCKLYAEYLFINKLNHQNLKTTILEAVEEIYYDDENERDDYEYITNGFNPL